MLPSPSNDDLRELIDGSLPDASSRRLDAHDSNGPDCRDELSRLESLIRDAHGDSSADTEASGPKPAVPAHAPGIGGYEDLRPLKTGGQGIVYEAIQSSTKRKVALKLLLEPFPSEEQLRRFEHEIECVAQLRHPNIVTVYECRRTDDDRPYYSMEFVDGHPLDTYLHTEEMSLEDRLRLFIKIADAIAHAHQHGVVHRDLKPGNILIDREGEPRIVDFGLAHRTVPERTAASARLTQPGAFLGTLAYAAPEQFTGAPELINELTDVWGLGVLLYEMLTDQQPFKTTGSPARIERSIREESPPKPSSVRRNLSIDLDAITLRALTKEPAHRYASVAAMAADVRRYLSGEPIEARRGRWRYLAGAQVKKTLRRHRWAVAVVVLLAGATFGQYVAKPVITRWTPANRRFVQFIATNAAPPPATGAMEHVRLIAIAERTDPAALAAREALPAASWEDAKSLRPLYGRLMERLAKSGAASVVWDVFLATDSAHDSTIARGVAALRNAGIPTTVAIGQWWLSGARPARIADVIAGPDVRWGCSLAQFRESAPWAIGLVAKRGSGDALPSLALAGAAAARHPDTSASYSFVEELQAIRIAYFQADPDTPQARKWPYEADLIAPVLTVQQRTDIPAVDLMRGDSVGMYQFDVPRSEVLESSTIELGDALTLGESALRDALAGKVVVIGNTRDPKDRWMHPDGRTVSGCQGHAAAIESIMKALGHRSSVLRQPIPSLAVSFTAAFLGIAATLVTAGRFRRWLALNSLLIAAAVGGSVLLGLQYRVIFDPFVPALTLAFASAITYVLHWARQEPVRTAHLQGA